MIEVLLGALVAIGLAALTEAYILIGRAQLLLNHSEQLLTALARLLAAVPGKSAPRSDAGPDAQPHRWWQRLRALPDVEPKQPAAAADVETVAESRRARGRARLRARLLEHADPPVPTPRPVPQPRPEPAAGPATVSTADAVTAWQHTEIPPRTDLPDDVDRQLARFTYMEGHTR